MKSKNRLAAMFILITLGLTLKAYPSCSGDNDCPVVEGLTAKCNNAGEEFSSCLYYEPNEIEVLAVTDQECSFCSIEATEKFLNNNFLSVNLKAIDYRSKQAKQIIKEYDVETLPFFLIGNEIKKEEKFHKIKGMFEEKNGKIIAQKSLSGVFTFLNRERKPRRIDLFLDLYDKQTKTVYSDLAKLAKNNKIELILHFVSSDENRGYPQEEAMAILAIGKIYPNQLDKYINWRIDSIDQLSWVNGLVDLNMNYKKIKKVMDSEEIKSLIEESDKLKKELEVFRGNVIVVNNNRIFQVIEVDSQGLMGFFRKSN